MRTSETVKELALYSSACCTEETLFDQNDRFSRCPACEQLCFWEYIEPVVSWLELEQQDSQIAA
jgi:hypothetical protein